MRLTVSIKTERKSKILKILHVLILFLIILDTDIVSGLAWAPDNQLFSCSDDKVICKWSAEGVSAGKIPNINLYISNISWFPSSGKQVCL
jgi:WD40 repeat protein